MTIGTRRPAEVELPERYRLLRHIADGGMASVWCAHDSVLSRKVAVKILAPQFQHDPRAVRRFAREARAAARLSGHRNIVTIYDVGGAGKSGDAEPVAPAFIVMEHLPTGTVADALRSGEASTEAARRWIMEAAAALDYAHGRGVVHGDIKPANLLLDSGTAVRIADFGLARISSDEEITITGQLFGTASYLSPEQALGARATAASDRYALAVVAFELLVGEKPFTADGFMRTARLHVDEHPPAASVRNPALPRTLDPVLERGMAKRPEERWATASALANAVDAAMTQRRVAFARAAPGAAAPSWPAHSPRRVVRHRVAGALAALAAVALLAGVAIGASQDGSTSSHRQAVARATARRAAAAKPKPHTAPPARPAPAPGTSTPNPTPRTPGHLATPIPQAPSAASLEARGHSMMLAGNYPAAIPVLQQAMRSAPSGSLLYQWSLFDLGHSYRETGDLVAAIPLLQERLQYGDQRPVVQRELNEALRLYRKQTGPQPPMPKHHGKPA